jgi:aryl-alcohol dehydrogenase-like predicted oxidoreductase
VEGRVNYRRLGRTGLEVSEVGYGAWGIGKSQWIGAEDDESLRALNRAINLGLNFIDTALANGEGHSERLVGQVVREGRDRPRSHQDSAEEPHLARPVGATPR